MTIFGYSIVPAKTALRNRIALEHEVEFWKAKYYYAKARAVIAEQWPQKQRITIRPRSGQSHEIEVTRS